jgi:hypothetical protein
MEHVVVDGRLREVTRVQLCRSASRCVSGGVEADEEAVGDPS